MSKIKITSTKKKNDLERGIKKDNVNMALIHEVLKQIRIIMHYKKEQKQSKKIQKKWGIKRGLASCKEVGVRVYGQWSHIRDIIWRRCPLKNICNEAGKRQGHWPKLCLSKYQKLWELFKKHETANSIISKNYELSQWTYAQPVVKSSTQEITALTSSLFF